MSLHEVCRFRSQERSPAIASNSELRRLCDQKAFHINGEPVTSKEIIDYPIISVVFLPSSKKKRCTIL